MAKIKYWGRQRLIHAMGLDRARIFFRFFLNSRIRLNRFHRWLANGFRPPDQNQPDLVACGQSGHHVFFGYYDLKPINDDDTIVLALRTRHQRAVPGIGDFADVGYFKIEPFEPGFFKIGKTDTWSWQQGCRLQWYPLRADGANGLVVYNRRVDNQYGCCIQDIASRKVLKTYKKPIYSLTPDGCYGLSLNYARLARLRPGYGAAALKDPTVGQSLPANDGIWRLDMDSGQADLLLSLEKISRIEPPAGELAGEHYVNHLSIGPDGNRFLFFHTWKTRQGRRTRLITCNLDGSEAFVLINEGQVSHYAWQSTDQILCFVNHPEKGSRYFIFRDRSREFRPIAPDALTEDGHPSFSPNGENLLVDTYPDRTGERRLLVYQLNDHITFPLGAYFSPYHLIGDLRCDLHPRWSPSGKKIAFDSAHSGYRALYLLQPDL